MATLLLCWDCACKHLKLGCRMTVALLDIQDAANVWRQSAKLEVLGFCANWHDACRILLQFFELVARDASNGEWLLSKVNILYEVFFVREYSVKLSQTVQFSLQNMSNGTRAFIIQLSPSPIVVISVGTWHTGTTAGSSVQCETNTYWNPIILGMVCVQISEATPTQVALWAGIHLSQSVANSWQLLATMTVRGFVTHHILVTLKRWRMHRLEYFEIAMMEQCSVAMVVVPKVVPATTFIVQPNCSNEYGTLELCTSVRIFGTIRFCDQIVDYAINHLNVRKGFGLSSSDVAGFEWLLRTCSHKGNSSIAGFIWGGVSVSSGFEARSVSNTAWGF